MRGVKPAPACLCVGLNLRAAALKQSLNNEKTPDRSLCRLPLLLPQEFA